MFGLPDEYDITTDPTVTWYHLENHMTGYTGKYGHKVDPHDNFLKKLRREGLTSRAHTSGKWRKEKERLGL